jgi:serine/threonine-protein kinase
MGSVFEAEHLTLGTRVAIKVLHGDLARRTGIAERFVQEARVSAQIRSAHVVQVIDVDRTPDGVAYLVMELLQGEPLSGVMRRERRLAVGTACEYASQILQALEAAHALGVIHRDLKPDNVFVTFQGGKPVLKLIDFGIAKLKTAQAGPSKNLTVAGMLMGTPEYMAPEQAYSADKVDVRADLYAVGVMLYEMLSGQAPATAEDPRVLILKVERGEVTPLVQAAPGIEPQLAGFVHRAMAPRPELRFANATEMRITLEEILGGKRPGTAKIAAQPSPALSAPPPAMAPAPPPPVEAPRPEQKGTGTVMGAPLEGALAAPHAGGTIGGAPIMVGPAPHPHYAPPPAATPYEPTRPPRKGSSGLIIALAVAALLLGAGAVVAYVLGTQPSEPPLSMPTFATNTPTATPVASAPATAVTSTTPATPLTTSTVLPTPPPGPAPVAKKDAGTDNHKTLPDAGSIIPPSVTVDASSGQTTIVTPFGTFEFPGPRPPFYPPDQPWPPPNILPSPPR